MKTIADFKNWTYRDLLHTLKQIGPEYLDQEIRIVLSTGTGKEILNVKDWGVNSPCLITDESEKGKKRVESLDAKQVFMISTRE
jgi:hypothetical protein